MVTELNENIKKELNTSVMFFLSFFIPFVMFLMMFQRHYTTDTVNAIINGTSYGVGNINLGRYSAEIVYRVITSIGLDYEKSFRAIILFMVLGFGVYIATVCKLILDANIDIKWDYKDAIFVLVAISLMVCNVFSQEWFAFWEAAFQWTGGLLFISFALIPIRKKISFYGCGISFLLLVIALGFYQGVIALFVVAALLVLYVRYEGELNGKSIIDNFLVLFFSGLASITNVILISIFQKMHVATETGRTKGVTIGGIINNLREMIPVVGKTCFLETCGLFPKYVFFFAIIVLLILFGVGNYQLNRIFISKSVYVLGLVSVTVACVFAPHVLASSLWMAQRTIVGMWALVSIPMICIWVTVSHRQMISNVTFACGALLLLLNYVYVQDVTVNMLKSNAIDEEIAHSIKKEIVTYEEESGNTIKNIGVIYDNSTKSSYDGVKYDYCDTNKRLYYASWSDANTINLFTGRRLTKIEVDEKTKEKFQNLNWDYYSPGEQLIFDGDTMFWICY